MLLTIVIPAYNMEDYLASCLNSILSSAVHLHLLSTFSAHLELLIVNDGSTDRTSAIAHDFERRYPDVVRVIDKSNGHYGSCVNAALPLVRGEYVKLLDADDTVNPANFAAFLEWLGGLSDRPDMIISDYVKVKPSGKILEEVSFNTLSTDHTFTPDEAMEKGDIFVQLHAVTHRTANLIEHGYRQLEGVPYTDFQWALTPIAYVKKIAYFPHPVVRYLVGRKGQTVDPAIVVRDVDTQSEVSLAIYREYRDALARGLSNCARYYAYHILRNYAWMIRLYVLGDGGHLPASDGLAFDRAAQSLIPEIHAAADSYALHLRLLPFHSSPSPSPSLSTSFLHLFSVSFYFIREYRRTGSRNSWKFRLYRLRSRLLARLLPRGRVTP